MRIVAVTPIQVQNQQPGDIAGPALSVVVAITNAGKAAFPGNAVGVIASYDNGQPASPVLDNGYAPIAGVVAPGQTATGTYPFSVPPASDSSVLVEVSYASGVPIAVLDA